MINGARGKNVALTLCLLCAVLAIVHSLMTFLGASEAQLADLGHVETSFLMLLVGMVGVSVWPPGGAQGPKQ